MEKFCGQIEQIEIGYKEFKIFGHIFKETPDQLDISNGKFPCSLLALFTGYRQLGTFKVKRPHIFKEGDKVIIFKENNKIVDIKKATIFDYS